MPVRIPSPRRLRWLALHHGPRRQVTVETPQGPIAFDTRDRGVGKALYLAGGYELDGIRQALALLRAAGWLPPGGAVIDAGANIGVTVIPLLALGGFDKALAVEPAPENLKLLRHNLERNRLAGRVQVAACALSDREGRLELEFSPDNWGDHRLRLPSGGDPAAEAFAESRRRHIPVPVRTLDGLLAELGWDLADVRLLWADIQGHEARMLAGAQALLARRVPVVSEFWPYAMRRAGTSADAYLQLLAPWFATFLPLPGDGAPRPLEQLRDWFAHLSGPRQMTQIVLLPR